MLVQHLVPEYTHAEKAGRANEWSFKRKSKGVFHNGGELKNHTLQSPHCPFCSVCKEKAFGRKQDYDYL